MTDTPTIFISYSHKDEKHKDFVVSHLRVAERQGVFDVWDDRRIKGGKGLAGGDRRRACQSRHRRSPHLAMRIPVKATGESSRRRPPNPVEGDQFGAEPLDARLMFIGKVAYRDFGIKSVA